MKSTKYGPLPHSKWSCCLHCKLSDTHKKMRLRTKSAGTIEQKGVAQLLQIEEVRLKSTRRCIVNHHMHKKLAFF